MLSGSLTLSTGSPLRGVVCGLLHTLRAACEGSTSAGEGRGVRGAGTGMPPDERGHGRGRW